MDSSRGPREARWLTVVSPENTDGVELLLDPMGLGPARRYQKALLDAGIPLTAFGVSDIEKESCGNLIQMVQQQAAPGQLRARLR